MAENKCQAMGCSLCCGNIAIEMTAQQVQDMRKAGTVLEDRTGFSDPEWLVMRLIGNCAYLIDGECSVYNTEKQPEACRSGYIFEGVKCRTRRGI